MLRGACAGTPVHTLQAPLVPAHVVEQIGPTGLKRLRPCADQHKGRPTVWVVQLPGQGFPVQLEQLLRVLCTWPPSGLLHLRRYLRRSAVPECRCLRGRTWVQQARHDGCLPHRHELGGEEFCAHRDSEPSSICCDVDCKEVDSLYVRAQQQQQHKATALRCKNTCGCGRMAAAGVGLTMHRACTLPAATSSWHS